jgi:hypothetical protein|tara:strand:- start:1432 stop:1659 length:228 start_codon:yes stop_codon:yes gene_type:complete
MSFENENNLKKMKLSDEALGALMMCLQKSLLEQSDIVPTLKNLDFTEVGEELFVVNPPVVKFDAETTDEETEIGG